MQNLLSFQHPAWTILSRLVLAIFGGYMLTNLIVVALVALVNPNGGGALLMGMSLSFALYVAIIIWAYSVRNLIRAWQQWALASTVFGLLTWGLIG